MRRFSQSQIFVLALFALVTGCGGENMVVEDLTLGSATPGLTPGGGGATGGPSSMTLGYQQDIRPIFQAKCASCHGAGSAMGNWMDYESTVAKKDRIFDRVVTKKDMPMGAAMDASQRDLIATWIKQGAPLNRSSNGGTSPDASTPPSPVADPQQPTAPISTDPTPVAPPVSDAPTEEAPVITPALSYERDMVPRIFTRLCQACHNANSPAAMPNWLDYDTTYAKRDAIYNRVVVKKDMPMGFPMTDEERADLAQWIEQGAKR